MMYSNFKIGHFDDIEQPIASVTAGIQQLNRELQIQGFNKQIKYKGYQDINEFWDDIKDGLTQFDIIILDMYEKNQIDFKERLVGVEFLRKLATLDVIPYIIICSRGAINEDFILQELFNKYSFIHPDIVIKPNYVKLGSIIENIVVNRFIHYNDFIFWDKDNFSLQADIEHIGVMNLKSILYKLKQKKEVENFEISKLATGFSGAFVFLIKSNNNKKFILKISKDKQKLHDEHQKSIEKYRQFPSQFIIDIGEEIKDHEVCAFIIEFIDHGKTLFETIQNESVNGINNILKDLFYGYGLKEHYSENQSQNTAEKKYFSIFKNFNIAKINLVRNAIFEYIPLLDYLSDKLTFDKANLINFIEYGIYNNLNYHNVEIKSDNKLTLSHGDFHSKNIIIKGKRPFIIDTGSIGMTSWCSDICRLIVDLFVNGYLLRDIDNYLIDKIPNKFSIGEKIINLKNIETNGNNFLYAINWIIMNIKDIFKTQFCLYEYQLGLLKEFLQISYRISSIPQSQKVLSLFLASECLHKANENCLKISD